MARRHYLIAYDMSDDRRRTRVFEMLKDFGDHVQFSVFLCELTRQELAGLRLRLVGEVDMRADQIIVLDLGESVHPLQDLLECIGRRYHAPSRVQVV